MEVLCKLAWLNENGIPFLAPSHTDPAPEGTGANKRDCGSKVRCHNNVVAW